MSSATAVSANEGWSAYLKLGFRPGIGKTVLAERQRFGPLAVQRPFYPEGGVCHVYLLHPPGGVAGGDQLHIEAQLDANCHALVTTPGATKFYRSAGSTAVQKQHLSVTDGACLEWFPQENIFFPSASVAMQTRIDLQGKARLAFWEIHCLGRPANQEAFEEGVLDSRLEIRRDGNPLLLERLRVDPKSRQRGCHLRGLPVTAVAVFSHAAAEQLERARAVLGQGPVETAAQTANQTSGATLIEDLLVIRYLGDSTEQARKLFTQLWQQLREPLMARPANTPRIWNT